MGPDMVPGISMDQGVIMASVASLTAHIRLFLTTVKSPVPPLFLLHTLFCTYLLMLVPSRVHLGVLQPICIKPSGRPLSTFLFLYFTKILLNYKKNIKQNTKSSARYKD